MSGGGGSCFRSSIRGGSGAPPFAPLAMAEVEFPTAAAAHAFTPPAWFGREVTEDPAYTNAQPSQTGKIP